MIAILILFGCLSEKANTPDVVNHECFHQPSVLDLGEGEVEFADFNADSEAIMVHGPQGGWHILGSFLLQNALQVLDVEFTIEHVASGAGLIPKDQRNKTVSYTSVRNRERYVIY